MIRCLRCIQPIHIVTFLGPFPTTTADYMQTRCYCEKCHGTLVPFQTKLNHQRKQLKIKTISEQIQRKNEVFSVAQHIAGPSSLASPACLPISSGISALPLEVSPPDTSNELGSIAHASFLDSDLDSFTNNISDLAPAGLSNAVDVNPEYVDVHESDYVYEDVDDFLDEDTPLDDKGNHSEPTPPISPPVSDPTEDNPDPFLVEPCNRQHTANHEEVGLPAHLLAVYTIVTWLHFQFHLPRVACSAVLAFLAVLFRFFDLGIVPPFVTLQSATRALGVDPGIELLSVCPKCRGVYPSSSSRHMQETCTACHIPLFLPEHTRQGNLRPVKVPVIKYPYLPLSDQIVSILKTPGVEALLDEWRTKPRKLGEYADIFDGRMCRLKLRAPDGSLFFSNRSHENNGPDNELRIGVNLGVDWYASWLDSFDLDNSALGFPIFVVTSHHPTRRVPPRF
jgi:hypothetical protein